MPVIACPGCGKKYNLPATAAGQVATCKCGKRFRLGGGPSSSTNAKPSSTTSKPASAATAKPPVVAAASKSKMKEAPASSNFDDGFWDDALGSSEPNKSASASPQKPSSVGPSTTVGAKQFGSTSSYSSVSKPAEPPKKKKKSGGVRWGADWGKCFGGLVTFLICGGLSYALFTSSGRISIYLVVVGVGGLFTAISGLMGEDGIW
jgi:hypothetical protein